MVKPAEKRTKVKYIIEEHSYSIRQACKLFNLHPSSYYYRLHPRDDTSLIAALHQFSEQHPSYGFKKLYFLLRSADYSWNKKRVYRVYKQMGLKLTRRRKRRLAVGEKQPLAQPSKMNEVWSMDFMHDALFNGVGFRTLNIIDDYNREILWIEIGLSIHAKSIVDLLHWLIKERGKPKSIRVDNGSEFRSVCFSNWCHKQRIEINYIQPGKPMQNGYIERFNRSYRTEVLDMKQFESIHQVRHLTWQWMVHYNQKRPHESLNNLSPEAFLLKEKNASKPKTHPAFFPFQQKRI